jgi:hypothetical protein
MERSFSRAAEAFAETLEHLDLDGSQEELGDPVALGRRAALLAVAERLWSRHLGPLFDVEQVKVLLGVGTRQAVSDLATRQRLLALEGPGGRKLYPAFQFGKGGRPLAGVSRVLDAFTGAAVSPYTVAAWFVSPQPLLEGECPAAWLRSGRDLDLLVEAARRSAAPLAH